MSKVCITIDTDWASDNAVNQTLKYFESRSIPLTIFTTHDSPIIRNALKKHEVGLHPFFGAESDHGDNVKSVTEYVLTLPHNIKAFRCHRFETSNSTQEAMAASGMIACSNICTDLEKISPFIERNGILEVPIFLEDGGYLRRGHPLTDKSLISKRLAKPGISVITIHPMHFCLNSPNFMFMRNIKDSMTRGELKNLSTERIAQLTYSGLGISDFVKEIIESVESFHSFSEVCQPHVICT